MLDRDGRIAHGRPDLVSKPLEHLRPVPIVVDHFNGCDSRWFGHSSMINAIRGSEVAQFPGRDGSHLLFNRTHFTIASLSMSRWRVSLTVFPSFVRTLTIGNLSSGAEYSTVATCPLGRRT